MNYAPIVAALALGLAAPLCAQTYQEDDLARLDSTLAQVKPGMRADFETGNWRYGCQSEIEARCRRKTYVIGGDIVLVGQSRGSKVRAAYTNGKRMTLDWLPRAALVAIPTPATTLASWRGSWSRDDESRIEIHPDKRPGRLKVAGETVWGSHDPERVKRGGVHLGDFSETAAPIGSRLSIADVDDICHVQLRLIGPYLVVVDNQQCGGANVSFSGVYRKH